MKAPRAASPGPSSSRGSRLLPRRWRTAPRPKLRSLNALIEPCSPFDVGTQAISRQSCRTRSAATIREQAHDLPRKPRRLRTFVGVSCSRRTTTISTSQPRLILMASLVLALSAEARSTASECSQPCMSLRSRSSGRSTASSADSPLNALCRRRFHHQNSLSDMTSTAASSTRRHISDVRFLKSCGIVRCFSSGAGWTTHTSSACSKRHSRSREPVRCRTTRCSSRRTGPQTRARLLKARLSITPIVLKRCRGSPCLPDRGHLGRPHSTATHLALAHPL